VFLRTKENFWLDCLASSQHPDPIEEGLAIEVVTEAAGLECIVPEQQTPLRLMGLKVRMNHLMLIASE
jgi:hypothetical protein